MLDFTHQAVSAWVSELGSERVSEQGIRKFAKLNYLIVEKFIDSIPGFSKGTLCLTSTIL